MFKFFAVLFVILCFTVPVIAQDTSVVTTGGDVYPVIDPAATVATLINTVAGLVLAAFGGAPVTTVLVSLFKRIPALDRFAVPTITFAVASVLYVLAVVASTVGFEVQFKSVLELITVVAPAVVSFITTLIGAPAIYEAAKRNDIAVIGESRRGFFGN